MIEILKRKISKILIFTIMLLITNNQLAKETLIYADNISYDKEENIIARGKAKIFYDEKIISSNLIIYSRKTGEIILPKEFTLIDEKKNYYYGSSGTFKSGLKYGYINDVKSLLNDGSRIVGKTFKKDNDIDIITKAVYSPCKSKIKIANFICPIWQLEGEKMLHDNSNLFLYQKHSKMRVFNIPVFYTPYLITPSPLRKERKSGFLTPSINFLFFDAQNSQTASFPYYFNLDVDKELTFTPILNYGGGVDSSQRFDFDYKRIISGGNFSSKLTFDTTIENQNTEKWLKQGSLINNYNQNINEKFQISLSSALQTSKNYIQETNPNDDLSYSTSLSSSIELNGYNLYKIDDQLKINITNYQSNQNNENNKTLPTVLPFINFTTGESYFNNRKYTNTLEFYNIFREKNTDIHSKAQRKLSSTIRTQKDLVKFKSNINYQLNFYNQYFYTDKKEVDNNYITGDYFRSFAIFGIETSTPFRFKNILKDFKYTPKLKLVVSPGSSNSNKLSNEDSSISNYSIQNNSNLNRYTGTDKLDNSKRIDLKLNISNNIFSADFMSSYEFTNNSNYHYSTGNEKKLSDLLGELKYEREKYSTNYNFRYDQNENYMKNQNLGIKYDNLLGKFSLDYLDQKSNTDDIITTDTKTINYSYNSKKFLKYSKISYFGLYDLIQSINTESGIEYSYFDECFGVNIDFKRNSYSDDNLKPQDILTIMFSFKNLGAYKSTNLAVSENEKQNIKWEDLTVDNELFN